MVKKAIGKIFILSKGYKYKVVYKDDDKSNGFQGLAVAPIVHGKVDYNNVQIAIAGTNANDNHDLITDASKIKEARDVADKDSITKKSHF
ncbi:hypothetical protein [Fructilactobacillus florum]|uniref:hypothetical protein n=1 Tax=Fructilactobacillus florum TaxID=640331 RepID=UPI000A4C18BC|nr:hypothetical protein [Fructilactobacillus florum]